MTNRDFRTVEVISPPVGDRAKRPVRADARRHREQIVVAARGLFLEGSSSVSMEDIAHRAGFAAATLARNFPKRSDLIEAVYQREVAQLHALADEHRNDSDAWVALMDWLHAFLELSRLTRVMFGSLNRIIERSPDLQLRTREIEDACGDLFERAQAAGMVRSELTRHDVVQLVGGLVFSLAADESRTEELFAVVMDGIHARTA